MTLALHSTPHSDFPANIASEHGLGERAPQEAGDVGRQVTAVLETLGLELAGLQPVASRLAMSSRTLERRLAALGLTFQGLVDAFRRERALWLLRNTDLCMDQIAIELGFSGAKNFSRTFRRWYGGTPSRMRKMPSPAPLLYQGTACGTPAESLQLSHR
jgi:transcriptional regulator GlxA family with amidase domain